MSVLYEIEIKQEPLSEDETRAENFATSDYRVKQEQHCKRETSPLSGSETALRDLYDKHEIKEEMVIGPMLVQNGASDTEMKLMKYFCDVCNKGFKFRSKLQSHSRSHTGDKPYSCDLCDKSFTTKCNLQTHTNDIHTNIRKKNKYACDVCGKVFRYKSKLDEHSRSHSGQRPYACNVCGKSFSRKCTLQRHVSDIHTNIKRNKYPCDVCSKEFPYKSKLEMHTRSHTGTKPYSCDLCGKSFKMKRNVQGHINAIHTTFKKANKYPCGVCNKGFLCNCNLELQAWSHCGNKPYLCDLCGKSFTMKCTIQAHIKAVHANIKRTNKYFCHMCNKGFPCNSYLEIHTRLHTGDKPYSCNLCVKSFSRKWNLDTHIDVIHAKSNKKKCSDMSQLNHQRYFCRKTILSTNPCKSSLEIHSDNGNKLYSGDLCANSLSMECNLQAHKNALQTQIKKGNKYSCHVCGKGFSCKSYLEIHTRSHTGDKPYSCDLCGKRFASKYTIRAHISAIHANVKKYKYSCKMCDKGFRFKSKLEAHSHSHTGERPYRCDVCGKSFKIKFTLQRHINDIHLKTNKYSCGV